VGSMKKEGGNDWFWPPLSVTVRVLNDLKFLNYFKIQGDAHEIMQV